MIQLRAVEGTGEELREFLKRHPKERFHLILLSTDGGDQRQRKTGGVRRGMFPELRGLTEDDFRAAEWHA
jgi:hypothetical protein